MTYAAYTTFIGNFLPYVLLQSHKFCTQTLCLLLPAFSLFYFSLFFKYSIFYKHFILYDIGGYDIPFFFETVSTGSPSSVFLPVVWYLFKTHLLDKLIIFSMSAKKNIEHYSIETLFRNAR